MAECNGRSAICMAPITRGIGGLDFRTQRRVEHILCIVIAGSLRAVHEVETAKAPSVVARLVCGRINVEANAGDSSFRFHIARLLAATARLFPISPFDSREGAVLLAHCTVEYCHVRSATRSEEQTSELQSPYDLVCRLL